MRFARAVMLVLAGLICGAMIRPAVDAHLPVAHAQDQMQGYPSCVNVVPKEWGTFMGASAFGLAFQDSQGTLRFLQHPNCNPDASSKPMAVVDLQIQRR